MSAREDSPSPPSNRLDSDGLRTILESDRSPCTSGVFPVNPDILTLFYGKKSEVVHRVELVSATEEELQRLADTCDPASFGRGAETVLDESYRKAGKLDITDFAINFDPVACGLLDTLRDILLEGYYGKEWGIRAELYKLNVYGPGSFFKPHKDTPHADDMFASLVIVFPTPHEGGALAFHHGDFSYTFDSAAAIAEADTPCVAFAAFFSDVEHEILPVAAGHRVTLTYNLYAAPVQPPSRVAPFAGSLRAALKTAFASFLANPSVLPEGGHVGFGLFHEYPVNRGYNPSTLRPFLKGRDAVLAHVCGELGLDIKVKVAYQFGDHNIMMSDNALWRYHQLKEDGKYDLLDYLIGAGAKRLVDEVHKEEDLDDWERDLPSLRIHWVTPLVDPEDTDDFNSFGGYLGNSSGIVWIYSNVSHS